MCPLRGFHQPSLVGSLFSWLSRRCSWTNQWSSAIAEAGLQKGVTFYPIAGNVRWGKSVFVVWSQFRHVSWVCPEVPEMLNQHKAGTSSMRITAIFNTNMWFPSKCLQSSSSMWIPSWCIFLATGHRSSGVKKTLNNPSEQQLQEC